MNAIKSKDNHIYKELLRLTRRKYRDESGLYLLEGPKPVIDAIDMGVHIDGIFLSEECNITVNFSQEKTWYLTNKLFREISTTQSSQGIVAAAKKKEYHIGQLKDIAAPEDNVLLVDRIQDPGNMGTMIRTAEAAGYKAIIIMKGSVDVYSPKVVRAAAGSLFRVPIFFCEDNKQAVKALKECHKKIVSTSPDTHVSCFDADISKGTALVIGNEGQGVSAELIEASDMKIKIPMEGSIESLNAAVAAGILMYQSQKTK